MRSRHYPTRWLGQEGDNDKEGEGKKSSASEWEETTSVRDMWMEKKIKKMKGMLIYVTSCENATSDLQRPLKWYGST